MGCGQSKIHLYPRKSKSKANGKKGAHADSDAETDEEEGRIEETEKYQNRDREKTEETEEQSNKDTQETDEEVSVSLLRSKNLSLLQSQEISTSQQNFFRMLDKKIEEGPDYDSASETEIALEEARLNALVQHWESASLTASICSSASRSLQTTPVRQAPVKQLAPTRVIQALIPMPQQVINAEFLPHGATQPGQVQINPQNQQILLPNMNTNMLHQMAGVPQIPMSMSTETSATTANTSNALAILQAAPNQSQQYTHLLTLPTGSPQLLGKQNVSPKRIVDSRLLISPSPLVQQMQNQYISASTLPTTLSGYVNGGRSPQPTMPKQMTYFGQPTAQQNMQTASQNDDQLQQQYLQQQKHIQQQQLQQQQQTPQSQNQSSYCSDVIHSTQAPPTEYRFPPSISVTRLAPQVQRQLRETQELIKDSCPQLYAAGYGSPGPPIRNQARNPTRRPTLETQFSQELS